MSNISGIKAGEAMELVEKHGAKLDGHYDKGTHKRMAAKLVLAASNVKEKHPIDSHAATKHLDGIATIHQNDMTRKADTFEEAHAGSKKQIAKNEIAGTEERHHGAEEVYGAGHKEATPNTKFSDEFQKKQEAHGNGSFVLNHSNGSKYLVDPQGYDHARYISKVKE